MQLFEIRNTEFSKQDIRGKLTQLASRNIAQVNVVESKKGSVRGGHYHKICEESFYLIKGSVKVKLRKGEFAEEEIIKEGTFFTIKPYIVHSLEFIEDTIMVVIYDEAVQTNERFDIYS